MGLHHRKVAIEAGTLRNLKAKEEEVGKDSIYSTMKRDGRDIAAIGEKG